MKKIKDLNALQEVMYQGDMSEKQFETKSKVIDYTILTLNQNEMYKKVLIGLSLYTKEEIYAMNSSKKNKIIKKHKEAQKILNIWKQEKLLEKSKSLLPFIDKELIALNKQTKTNTKYSNSFCHVLKNVNVNGSLPEVLSLAALKQLLTEDVEPDPTFLCSMSFKDLEINKTDIINKLIDNKLLPLNFSTI
jgi:hypothetical protein